MEKTLALYAEFPATEENTVERHMQAQLGMQRSIVKTACRQQGLLHLYKQFCIQGKCNECKLGIRECH